MIYGSFCFDLNMGRPGIAKAGRGGKWDICRKGCMNRMRYSERVAETCEACDQTATGRDIKDGDSRKDGNTRGTVVQQHK